MVVTDSVFSVNRGTKGTRVSVLEGTVRVDWRGEQRMLAAGQQLSTNRFINGIPIRDEVAWSGLVQQQTGLLNREADPNAPATQALGGDIRWPQLRYGSSLLDRLPADTLLFVAVPNDKDALDGAKALIDKQMRDNAVLQPCGRTAAPAAPRRWARCFAAPARCPTTWATRSCSPSSPRRTDAACARWCWPR